VFHRRGSAGRWRSGRGRHRSVVWEAESRAPENSLSMAVGEPAESWLALRPVGGGECWAWLRDRRLSEQELVDRGIRALDELGRDDPLWPGQLAMLAALLL
jgi:hypothetical protein